MKKLFFLPLLLAAGFSNAQITLSQSDFASVGDTVFLATDATISGTNVGTAGASAQIWNFTHFNIESMDTLLFVAPGSAVGGADFPSANVALVTGQTSTFFNKTSTSVQILGNGGAAAGFGFSAPFAPPYNILTYPTSVGTSIHAVSGFDVTEYIGLDTTATVPFVGSIHVVLDSVRFKRELTSDITFDAHGNVGLPIGSYPALRSYNVQVNNDTIYALMGVPVNVPALGINLVAGWIVITPSIASAIALISPNLFLGQTTGITTTRSYDWYANSVGYRLASVELDTAAGHAPKRVQYLSDPALMSVIGQELLPSAFVYPNPTAEFLGLSGVGADMQGNIAVLDLNGKTVMNARYVGQTQISVSELATGTYFFRLTDKQGRLVFSDKFQVVK